MQKKVEMVWHNGSLCLARHFGGSKQKYLTAVQTRKSSPHSLRGIELKVDFYLVSLPGLFDI